MTARSSRLARAALAALALASTGMRYPPPHEIGHVYLDHRARKAGVPGVAFEHYKHRANFTCRVCHVDVGFAMAIGDTGISAKTNAGGFHCGACHDGKKLIATGNEQFASRMPRNAHGAVDWEKAEAQGRVKPLDVLEGVSVPRPAMRMDRDIAIAAETSWVADIIFSHRKHAIWNGCEVCHPEIFPAAREGRIKYTMFQISRGEYCGACHDKVAFPIADCEGCHRKPVR